jgi:hypothetical protein
MLLKYLSQNSDNYKCKQAIFTKLDKLSTKRDARHRDSVRGKVFSFYNSDNAED